MEDWIGALRSVQKWETYEVGLLCTHSLTLAARPRPLTLAARYIPGQPVQHGAFLRDAQLVRLLARPAHLLQRLPGGAAGGHLPRPVLRR